MFDLRYYQQELICGARKSWQTHQSCAIISATGTGKTEMYMALAISQPGRVLVLVHRDYLISQPIARLKAAGFTDVAIEKAEQRSEGGHKKAKIVFASVQSIGPESQARRLATFNPADFSLIIVDEGHRGTSPTYRRVLTHFRQNRQCKILILTATPNRKDGVALANICDTVAGTYGPSRAMAEGWIVPVKFYRRDVKSLDFTGVKMRGSDLDPEEVQRRLMEEKPLHEVCASLAEDTGPTIVFCPEVAVARAYESLMNSRYRPNRAKMLYAESPDEEREEFGKKLAQGEIDYIFNVNLYTEGYDLPNLLRVVWASPTASLVRYTQGVGRVFRTHPSLRSHLTGGIEEAESRKMLIEQSPKPFGLVVTYYPQNCAHELCDPIDILGGEELPPSVKKYAKLLQDDTARQEGGSTTAEDIETSKVFCDLFGVLDARAKEIKAKASFNDVQFDPMSGRRVASADTRASTQDRKAAAAVASANWPEGEPATEKQIKWLRWKGADPSAIATCTKWRASVVRDLFEMGVPLERSFGYGKSQALKVRAEMMARREAATSGAGGGIPE